MKSYVYSKKAKVSLGEFSRRGEKIKGRGGQDIRKKKPRGRGLGKNRTRPKPGGFE